MKKIIIITGHFGSGKTNFSVNLAVNAAEQGESVTVADLDIVNPYFRTADFAMLFKQHNITLSVSDYANSNLDIPSVNFDITDQDGLLIIDVGGDDAGAAALGRYAQKLSEYDGELEVFYIINRYRYLTRTPEEALELMYEIEAAARIKHTAIVNNSNLGSETTAETVGNSIEFAECVAEKAGIPLMYTTCPEDIVEDVLGIDDANDIYPVKIYVRPFWENKI